MRPYLVLLTAALTVSTSGCSWIGMDDYVRDRSDDYRKAEAIPEMDVPEGLSTSSIESLYPIPPATNELLIGTEFEVPRPAPLLGDDQANQVRIQKLGNEQWILLDGSPSEIWPRIRSFLIANRIAIEGEDPSQGLIDSSWLAFKSDPTRREKYRYRVEQGIQRNSTEIYVLQSGYMQPEGVEVEPPQGWPEVSNDLEREAWMVRELAGYLAETSEQSSVSLLAQGISTTNKVYMTRVADGTPIIDLRLPFERAWASLGRSLSRGGFTTDDLNRDAQVYYITFNPEPDEEEEGGIWDTMFGWWGDDAENNPWIGRAYRVRVHEAEEGVTVTLERDDNNAFDEGEAEFILGIIKANLA